MNIFNILKILFEISSKASKRAVAWFCVIFIISFAHFFPQQYDKASKAVMDYYIDVKISEAQVWANIFVESFQKKDIQENVKQ
jgi:hypothetical protein